jgi:K+-sensing histidine kinase KdpD
MEQVFIMALTAALLVACCLVWRLMGSMKRIRRAERIKKAFLRHISQEVHQPLKVVKKLAGTVAQEDLYLSKNEKRNISEQLNYNANLVNTLMDEVLMFTDAAENGHLLKKESFSPNALCRRCLEANMGSLYHREAVTLDFKRDMGDEFFVRSDRHLVELIVNKLICSACKFTEEGAVTVGCNTHEYPDSLTIFVQDTGVGIPENRMGKLFSFFDEPDDIKDEVEMDLSICQRVAEKLGGHLLLDPIYKKGTRMLLVLPLRA